LTEFIKIVILAVVQGLAELLPVSSSAHVIVAEKLMGKNPSSPEMTLLLVMLHTGTMFAVIVYFWRAWKASIFASRDVFFQQAVPLAVASALTAFVYEGLKKCIEKLALPPGGEIESLFSNLGLVAGALAAAGILILVAGLAEKAAARDRPVDILESLWIGFVQGFCVPFRGFSRSGATISTGLLLGVAKAKAEEFSFALAIILTPPAIGLEFMRFLKARKEAGDVHIGMSTFAPSLIGMVFAFLAGLLALKWLSRWLENGRWYFFGIYCLLAATGVFVLYCRGY
jgi:undecaprenyl-diphosphatase